MPGRRAIGLITTFISGRFFEQLMTGVQAVARQHHADVLVFHATPEQVSLARIAEQRVDGWLVLTYPRGLDSLAAQGKPVVTISCRVPNQAFPAVFPDNRQGMKSIMEYLIGKGHRRIAFVGDTTIGDIAERYAQFQSSLADHDLALDPALVVETDSPLAARGAEAARELIGRSADLTAVVAGNDWTAIGVMRELQASGRRVPEDVAVIGFDDISEAQISSPPLSTVRQHTDELGATATRLLLDEIAGSKSGDSVHYIPTTFVLRESSGNPLVERIAGWAAPSIPAGPLLQTALSRELTRILLPALPLDPPPSPAQVWPEVDRLVQLLTETVNGATIQALDPHLMEALFTSPAILNASSETLAEMLRILDLAGRQLTVDRPDAPAAQTRLYALLDQLMIEVMRSYRRRQTSARRTLSEILQSQYNISQFMLKSPPEQLDWLSETPFYSGCLGLWSPLGGNQPAALLIAGAYQRGGGGALRLGASAPADSFPPLDLLPSSAQPNDITTALVMFLRSADHDWGALVVSGPLISNDPWLEDNTINTLEICCGFLVLALERQVLKESLRDSADNEQLLADRIHSLHNPAIALMDGVLLVPVAALAQTDQFEAIIGDLLRDGVQAHTTDVFLDLTGVSALKPALVRSLIEAVQTLARRDVKVTLIGLQPDLQQRMLEQGVDQGHYSGQPSLAVAIEQVSQTRRE
jgi:DNA-binding LacI/PurR family transcriptional regulator/anti-anti-sigma regulatory factor